MASNDDSSGSPAHGGEPAAVEAFNERAADYLVALWEALNLPTAQTDARERVYYRVLRDRVAGVVDSLKATLRDGPSRALPEQTVALRVRIAKLPTAAYRHTAGDAAAKSARPTFQVGGEPLHAQVTDFLTALLDMLEVPEEPGAPGHQPAHPWLVEDRAIAAEIALTMLGMDDLSRSLPREAASLRDRLAELREARYVEPAPGGD